MSTWELPISLIVGDIEWKIRSDYRAVLDILKYFSDPDYEQDERWAICLDILYEDFKQMSPELYQEAAEKAMWFLDVGEEARNDKSSPALMDWEQDAGIIIPAVNKVIGREVRSVPYMHWWTFVGAYMEIGESLFSQVLSIRQKKSKGKKLEKWEREFYTQNKNLIDLKKKYSEEEKQKQQDLIAMLD